MPSSVIGALRVNLGLDSAQFNRGASDAEKRAYAMGEKIGKAIRSPIASIGSLKGAIGGLAGALALKELAGATQRAFDYADSIQDLADRSGASTKAIQEFRFAAQLSGSSVEVADAATEKFARTLGLAQQGSDTQVKLFRELGVTSTDFDTALRQTLDGIAKLPTVQQRAATGFQIFGKSSATLTGLLGQGSKGFDLLAQKAHEYGIVIADDVIRNAGAANDKLDTLKMILNAQFANAVVQNANSLVALAGSITAVTAAMIKFLSSSPETALAILGGLAGSRAGLPGAALGAFGGYALGRKVRQNAEDSNTDLKFRLDKFNTAKQNYRDAKAFRAGKGNRNLDLNATAAEFVKQGGLIKDAQASYRASKAGTPIGGNIPLVGNAEGKSASDKAAAEAKRLAAEQKHAAEKAKAEEREYQRDLARSRDDQLNAQLDLTVDQTERVNIQQQLLDHEHQARLDEIDTNKNYTEEHKKQLRALENGTASEEGIATLKARLLHQQDQDVRAQQALDKAQNDATNQEDILSAQLGLARTTKARREIEQQILDQQFKLLKLVQQEALDTATRHGDKDGVAAATANLKTIGQLQGYANAKNAKDNQGPLASYLDSIPKSAAEVNEAIEAIQANGLSSLIDGLSNVEGGFKGLANTVRSVANDIISSLIKIGMQKAFASLFGNALSSASAFTASSFTNPTGGPTAGGYTFAGARAKGGPVTAGKMYMVGEKGPEPFIPNTSGTIIPHGAMNGGGVMEVRLRDQMLDARIISGSSRVTQAGIEQNNSQQSKYASRRLGR